MNLLITILVGIGISYVLSQLKKFTQSVQGQISCIAIYIIEIFQCIFAKSIRIFSKNGFISIILMIFLPFVILCIFYILSGVIKSKKNINDIKKVEE